MLTAKPIEITLGSLRFGQPYFFSYNIKNEYDEPLEIEDIVAGCSSCTLATSTKTILAPGEEAEIRIQFTPGDTGHQTKKVTIINRTMARKKPNVTLTFKATVQ